MLLQTVPARTGLQWALMGIRTFWRQPLALAGLFFMFMATVSLASMVPVVGTLLALALMPALTAGIMAATQIALEGRFPMPGTLWLALREPAQRRSMLTLGGLYALAFVLMLLVSWLIDGGQFARIYLGADAITPEAVDTAGFQSAVWASMLLYAPLSMLFWHAPALVFWQKVPPAKSLFFSWMACWRNKWAFAVYVACWMVLFSCAALLAILVAQAMGNAALTLSILMPFSMLVAAMFFTSMLFTVKDCFSASEPQLA